MILDDLFGTEPPDPFEDAIAYHQWHEANRCPCCKGRGWRLYNYRNRDPFAHECQCCLGSGMRDEEWMCDGHYD